MDQPTPDAVPSTDAAFRADLRAASQRIRHLAGARAVAVVLRSQSGLELVASAGLEQLDAPALAAWLSQDREWPDTPCEPTAHTHAGLTWLLAFLHEGGRAQGLLWMGFEPGGLMLARERERATTFSEALVSTLRLHRMSRELLASEERYRLMFLHNPLPMYVSSFEDRRMLAVNPAMLQLYGYEEAEFLSLHSGDLLAERDPLRLVTALGETASQRRIQGLQRRHRRKDGTPLDVEVWTDEIELGGRAVRLVLIYDVTERKRAERAIERLAYCDSLTGLDNRARLLEGLRQALSSAAQAGHSGALLLLDLDHFKLVNEIWGHEQGDRLLQELAQRLCAARPDALVARLGGDEFALVLEALSPQPEHSLLEAQQVARQVLAELGKPCRVGALDYPCHASIGIVAFGPHHGTAHDPPSTLLQRADIALYEAKNRGRQSVCVFDQHLQASVTARVALEVDARQALSQQAFSLHYQPQLDSEGVVLGVEALARWEHLRRGWVPPSEFIPLCEDSGLIVPLGEQVLAMACATLAQWRDREPLARLSVSVNVSSRQFRQPGFVGMVEAALAHSDAPPGRLKLELTESVMVDNIEAVVAKMAALKALGVRFSLDDFGTGYSSLAYLKLLPLDQLKIDQSFVRDVLTDGNDAAIARTVIALGRSLGLEVIAEGVETEAQRDFLAHHGCNTYQGYLYGRPLPQPAFESWLMARHARDSQLTS